MEDLSFRGSERGLEFALENGGETYTVSIPATPEEGHLFGDMAAAKVNPANSAPLSSFVDSVLGYTDREVGAELVDIGEELGNGNGDRRIVMTLDGEREVFANPATAIYFDSMAGEDFNYGILTGLGDPQVSPRDHSDWIDMNLEEPREADIPSETTKLSYEAYGVNLEPGYQPLPFLELSGDEADIRFPFQHMMADITPSLMQQQFLRERRKTLGEGETGPGFYPDRALVAARPPEDIEGPGSSPQPFGPVSTAYYLLESEDPDLDIYLCRSDRLDYAVIDAENRSFTTSPDIAFSALPWLESDVEVTDEFLSAYSGELEVAGAEDIRESSEAETPVRMYQ